MTISSPVLSIVVPTLNRVGMLQRCLESIAEHTDVAHEIIVHANECSADTAALLRRFPQVRAIESDRNLFFTQAVNRGIEQARGEFVFLMNDDCEATGSGWANFYIDLLETDPRVGVVGPHWKNIDELPFGWIEPYAAMYRRSTFERHGLLPFFDGSFRLWWSDIYHAYRLMSRGLYLLPLERSLADSVVKHARPAGVDGATVIKMRSHLPAQCFQFHGKLLMYQRLGIVDDTRLAGYYGDRVWTRSAIGELVDVPQSSADQASG